MTTILDTIVAHKKQEVKERSYQFSEDREYNKRSFLEALQNPNRSMGIIAEVKKASPSKGVLVDQFSPVDIAREYDKINIDAISVLTDERFFQGHDSYLMAVKECTSVPVLRKEFIVDEKQIYESKAIGADAILLIAAILDKQQIKEYMAIAEELDLDVLMEVHDEAEIEKVLSTAKPKMIGVNNRNLKTFETTLETTKLLAKYISDDVTLISESGIKSSKDVQFLSNLGVNGLLVGEAFMKEKNKGDMLSQWFMEAASHDYTS
ncbi:indole-3-glycerol phosphate synthase TrpC [Evansella cellulosilytica]|uniref:Indole-3-glycerol phosphate synthase n=1 Tax=Evansella cellulosilytica (strain ATCC 21833 / DSM 2522 / FERM P-1141 / JCM 9156 / N-4) TaxID=649639 RepID=E6TZG6_EVAC2|nr:indole-3-glycerol phosphate synthase TrpC [Evansella cellulosilytica]ADU30140.1 Indole-3-glycerol-phosphate synthase [Evansella cellulosilytica DSM 2522]